MGETNHADITFQKKCILWILMPEMLTNMVHTIFNT